MFALWNSLLRNRVPDECMGAHGHPSPTFVISTALSHVSYVPSFNIVREDVLQDALSDHLEGGVQVHQGIVFNSRNASDIALLKQFHMRWVAWRLKHPSALHIIGAAY